MIHIKTEEEIKIMAQGGKRLCRVKKVLEKRVDEGVTAYDIEVLANELIEKKGGKASFKMVPGYHWATCVNVNAGLVHGIPRKEIFFKRGDVVSVDVGLFYNGYHTDTSITVAVDPDGDIQKFLETGRRALTSAIDEVKSGKRIYDISRTLEDIIVGSGYSPIRALVGHGIGRELHEEPQIPCFVPGKIEDSPKITEGMVLAIEVMYTMGKPEVEMEPDGWTIVTSDGKISALFEETVAVTDKGPVILTA